MANNLIYVRVLQHDKDDQISIGVTTPIWDSNMDTIVYKTKAEYEKKNAWYGDFKKSCKRFYKRIAIVDAQTLEVIRVVYEREIIRAVISHYECIKNGEIILSSDKIQETDDLEKFNDDIRKSIQCDNVKIEYKKIGG